MWRMAYRIVVVSNNVMAYRKHHGLSSASNQWRQRPCGVWRNRMALYIMALAENDSGSGVMAERKQAMASILA